MAKRDEILKNFLENPLLSELSNIPVERLADISFANSANDPLIDSLKRMITSAIVNKDTVSSTIKAVNTGLKI
ncbi:MAG: hypothetical protein P8O79_10635 [Halieaceae bacterium]|nr:hypothetical protein [Halieaceae bacterium]